MAEAVRQRLSLLRLSPRFLRHCLALLAVLALALNAFLFAWMISAPAEATPPFDDFLTAADENRTSRGAWEWHGNAFVWSLRFPSAQQQHAVVGFGSCDISSAIIVSLNMSDDATERSMSNVFYEALKTNATATTATAAGSRSRGVRWTACTLTPAFSNRWDSEFKRLTRNEKWWTKDNGDADRTADRTANGAADRVADRTADDDVRYLGRKAKFVEAVFAKIAYVHDILLIAPPHANILFADTDTLALKSYDLLLPAAAPFDVTFMDDGLSTHTAHNTGFFVARNTPHTRALFAAWLDLMQEDLLRRGYTTNQQSLGLLLRLHQNHTTMQQREQWEHLEQREQRQHLEQRQQLERRPSPPVSHDGTTTAAAGKGSSSLSGESAAAAGAAAGGRGRRGGRGGAPSPRPRLRARLGTFPPAVASVSLAHVGSCTVVYHATQRGLSGTMALLSGETDSDKLTRLEQAKGFAARPCSTSPPPQQHTSPPGAGAAELGYNVAELARCRAALKVGKRC